MPQVRIGVLTLVALLFTVSLGAQQPEATLKRAVAAYNGAASISARFNQTVTNPLTSRALTTSGELVRKLPNLLSISFNGKDPDRIVSDGSELWVYLPSTAPGQVIKIPAASGEAGMLIDPMGQILSAPSASYAITDAGTEKIDGRATHAITLTPKSSSSLFTRATLWIDDSTGLVWQLESTEPSGLVRKITVTQFRTNVPVPRSTFQFTPPPGVRVIDAGGMLGGQGRSGTR
ncbi:MAG: outer membrane lipoprotein carrier protein LolA [Gemmatimonadaceae bacterium]